MNDLDDLIFFCHFSNVYNREDDAINYMKQIIQVDPVLDVRRRVLFQQVYKTIVDSMRNTLCVISSYYDMEEQMGRTEHATELQKKKEQLVSKLLPLCKEVIQLVDDVLLPNAQDEETQVYFLKLKGDFYRYVAEYSDESESVAAANAGEDSYNQAYELSMGLSKCDPVRLSLILNMSVFKYEIRKDMESASEMLEDTLANLDINSSPEDNDKRQEILGIVSIMKQNMSAWAEEMEEQAQAAE